MGQNHGRQYQMIILSCILNQILSDLMKMIMKMGSF